MLIRLFQVCLNNFDQLLSALGPLLVALTRWIHYVQPDVVCDDLGHQAVHRAARRNYKLKDLGTTLFLVKRAFNRLDLPSYPPHPRPQLLFLFNCVTQVNIP
jgi:hypothetical protein